MAKFFIGLGILILGCTVLSIVSWAIEEIQYKLAKRSADKWIERVIEEKQRTGKVVKLEDL